MKKNIEAFIEHVRSECKKYKIKLVLRNVSYFKLTDGIRCSGYFDEDERVLAVAMKKDIWLGVLVHEYAHLTQWVEGCDAWKNGCKGIEKVDRWLGGEKVRDIKKALAFSRDLELDNEKRAVKLIKKWNLPIDVKDYVKRANAYVQFYNYMYFSKKWCRPNNSPYDNPVVVGAMPSTFRMNYETMSDKYKQLYIEQNI
jgi:hypothetical protein